MLTFILGVGLLMLLVYIAVSYAALWFTIKVIRHAWNGGPKRKSSYPAWSIYH